MLTFVKSIQVLVIERKKETQNYFNFRMDLLSIETHPDFAEKKCTKKDVNFVLTSCTSSFTESNHNQKTLITKGEIHS